ncbi:MAG TPA: hypothetical protein VFV43_05785 [Limnobacter sp.]|nr:hypothetical protein [Limnobacter sp.]
MPRTTSHAAQRVAYSNALPLTPAPGHVFRHNLSHATQELASSLRAQKAQNAYALNSSNSNAPAITDAMLKSVLHDTKRSLHQAFHRQSESRRQVANERKTLVNNLQLNLDTGAPVLQQFKAMASVLPDLETDALKDSCCEHPEQKDRESRNKNSGGCEHEDGGGIVIDLDEAAHGAFASSKYLNDVAKGRPEAVAESFKTDAADMARQPIQHLGNQLTHGGAAEFSTAVGAGVVMLPLAGLAIKAGLEEWQHASHALKDLEAEKAEQRAHLDRLKSAAQAAPSGALNAHIQAQALRLDKLDEAGQHARSDRGAGAMSAASGLSIGLKALSDIGLKVSLGIKAAFSGKSFFALSESAQAGTAAAGAAVGFGIAGTFVLGPLAGIFATALGGFFTVKTLRKLKQLKSDFKHLQADLKATALASGSRIKPSQQPLHDFLIRQGNKRIGFFKRFGRWNKAFMVGSGLYAASAVTKAVVVGVAAAGIAAAASNPIGLGVITAVGILGALAMGITSFSFLRGHGKQGKYSRATAGDHSWVDRRLMTDLHGVQTSMQTAEDSNSEGPSNGRHLGFDMAASCLRNLNQQKQLLREFMAEAAKSANKHSPMEKHLSWWQHLGRRVINRKVVEHFVQTEQGVAAFNTLVKGTLVAQLEMLKDKLEHRDLAMAQLKLAEPPAEQEDDAGLVNEDTLRQTEQLAETYARFETEYAADQGRMELTLLRLKHMEDDTSVTVEQLADYVNAGTNMKAISDYLHADWDRQIRHARGVLFESQLEGARLRDQQYRAQNPKG